MPLKEVRKKKKTEKDRLKCNEMQKDRESHLEKT